MQKIYIAGCGGMLGEAIYDKFGVDYKLCCSDKAVNDPWISYLDFRDFENYQREVFKFRPDYLFHIGAFTDLEYCELNPEETYLNNTEAVKKGVQIANDLNIPIVFISTAGIFSGQKDSYDEYDKPEPLGVYAKSKYASEVYIQQHAKTYIICRAGWMMGGGPRKDKKFVQKIMKQLREGKRELLVVNDRFGVPTYTHDFAKNLKFLLEKEFFGLFNMVNQGQTNRFEVTKEILNILNLQQKVSIKPVESSYLSGKYFAPRPQNETLINRKLEEQKLDLMRDWKSALFEYLSKYYSDYL